MRTDLNSNGQAAIAKRRLIQSGALRLSLSPVRRFWGGIGTLTINGEDYLGVGARALVSPISSELGGAAGGVTITLSALDPDIAATIENEDYSQKPCVLRRLIFDENGVDLLSSMVVLRGKLDKVTIREVVGGEAALDFYLENSARDLSRTNSTMMSDVFQRLIGGASDGSLKHMGSAGKQFLSWGKRPADAPYRPGYVNPFVPTRPYYWPGF